MFIESIGMAAATPAAIKPQQLSLPLAKLFTLSRTASNHDFLISILLLGRWYDGSAAAECWSFGDHRVIPPISVEKMHVLVVTT